MKEGLVAVPREKDLGIIRVALGASQTGHPAPFPYHQDTPTSATRLDAIHMKDQPVGWLPIRSETVATRPHSYDWHAGGQEARPTAKPPASVAGGRYSRRSPVCSGCPITNLIVR